ncbi:MAG: hypothetical protein MZV64_23680 [Ignavibacteriales bacterium]|nr:hypothetical protein [Ignavibacteriales bacterium]
MRSNRSWKRSTSTRTTTARTGRASWHATATWSKPGWRRMPFYFEMQNMINELEDEHSSFISLWE